MIIDDEPTQITHILFKDFSGLIQVVGVSFRISIRFSQTIYAISNRKRITCTGHVR